MANVRFTGDAPLVAQVATLTPANVEIGDVFTVTMGGDSISFTASVATVSHVTAGLTAAWNSSGLPQFAEITAADTTTTVTLTADTTGKAFTVSTSTTDGGGANTQTLTYAVTTANSGPNDWSVAANWSGNAIPVNSDVVYIEGTDTQILYGLDQSAVTLTALYIDKSYTGKIGLPEFNNAGYAEYRDTYLKIGATTIFIGNGAGNGANRIKLNTGTVQTSLNVSYTATAESGGPGTAVLWKGTNASNAVTVIKGSVGCAILGGEVCTISALRVGQADAPDTDAVVRVGDGSTLTTATQMDGILTSRSNVPTLNQFGGEFGLIGAATCTTANVYGGSFRDYSTGTITTLNVSAGTFDCSRDTRARTVTNCNVYSGATISDPSASVTWTNGIILQKCSLTQVTLDVGYTKTLTL